MRSPATTISTVVLSQTDDKQFVLGSVEMVNGAKYNLTEERTLALLRELEFDIVTHLRQELGDIEY